MTVSDQEYAFLKEQLPGQLGTLTDLRKSYFESVVGTPGTINDLSSTFFKTNERNYWNSAPSTPSPVFLHSDGGTVSALSKTWAAVPLGEPSPTRTIVVAIGGRAAYVVSSLTIGGVAATIEASQTDSGLWLAYANVPDGTTGNVVINWTTSQARAGLILWSIDAILPAAHAVAVINGVTGTIASPANGVVLAAAYWNNALGTTAWVELTKSADQAVDANGMSGAVKSTPEAATVDIGVTNTGGSIGDIVAVSYAL